MSERLTCEHLVSNNLLGFDGVYYSLFALVLISGSPIFNADIFVKISLPTFFVFLLWKYSNRLSLDFVGRFIAYVVVFVFVFFVQYFIYGVFQLAYFSFVLKVFCAGLVINLCAHRFSFYYFDIVYRFSVISLIFYFAQLLFGADIFPLIPNFNDSDVEIRSVLVHTALSVDQYRNAGFTWEPGAFQGFIVVAFLFMPQEDIFSVTNRKKSFLMIIALLTTFSTTGYVCFAIYLLGRVLYGRYSFLNKSLLVFVFSLVSFVAYFGVDFIGEKIQDQIQDAVQIEESDEYFGGRFSSYKIDEIYLNDSPFIGSGFAEETRWRFHPEFSLRNVGHGNGFVDFFVSVGFVAGLYYFFLLYKSAAVLQLRLVFMVVFILMLQGEHFLNLAFFLGVPFINHENK